jgi:hypothetical protein
MPNYVATALHQFQHQTSAREHHALSRYNRPQYGVKTQMTEIDTSEPITPQQKLTLQ